MKNYIVVSTCDRLVRQVTLALLSMPDTEKIVVVGNEKTKNLRWTAFCKENRSTRFDSDDEGFVKTVNDMAAKMQNATLVPTDCDAARLVIRTRQKIKPRIVPIPQLDTLETLDNKWRFYEFCRRNDIRVPDTIYIGDKKNLSFRSVADNLGLPFILKPVNQAGSNGVQIIHSEKHFNESILDNDLYAFDKLIAQKYIAGIDLCFNFLATGGKIIACSIQQRIGSEIRFLNNPELERLGQALASASAYDGVMCIDARAEVSTGSVYLIESNPRFWASLCASVWCGLNFVAEAIAPSGSPDAPLRLTEGRYHERHPFYRPASWPLVLDTSRHGKIFRAMMRDMPVVLALARSFPVALWKYAMRRMSLERTGSLYGQ